MERIKDPSKVLSFFVCQTNITEENGYKMYSVVADNTVKHLHLLNVYILTFKSCIVFLINLTGSDVANKNVVVKCR